MPPKFDPEQVNYVYIKCIGGQPPPTANLAPKIGAFGIAPKKVGDQIAADTVSFKGIKCHVAIRIQNRQATTSIVPSASALILRALREPIRDRKKEKNVKHSGSITFSDLLNIGQQMRERSLAKEMSGTLCEILGTCHSIGCKVDGLPAPEMIAKIRSGEFDELIGAA
ncbi:large ribosomal subunit protein uL11-like [Zophobas morio]